jgi:hypothetical protein
MSALDGLFGLRRIFRDGVEQVFRASWDFVGPGWGLTWNPTTKRLELSLSGGGSGHTIVSGELFGEEMPQRPKLAFTWGDYIWGVADDNETHDVTILRGPVSADFGCPDTFGLVPAAPETGTKMLTSINGVQSWADPIGGGGIQTVWWGRSATSSSEVPLVPGSALSAPGSLDWDFEIPFTRNLRIKRVTVINNRLGSARTVTVRIYNGFSVVHSFGGTLPGAWGRLTNDGIDLTVNAPANLGCTVQASSSSNDGFWVSLDYEYV